MPARLLKVVTYDEVVTYDGSCGRKVVAGALCSSLLAACCRRDVLLVVAHDQF
jgi:hypothetical protein